MSSCVSYSERRFTVHSRDMSRDVPAGRYDTVEEAVDHANSVTYRMYVFDREQGIDRYRNWDEKGEDDD
jgi:hypothetical protein